MRHNEIKNTFATLMSEVCFDVEIEPKLQSFQGESCVNNSTTTDEDARLDVKAKWLWGSRFIRTFFDVKVFNPHAKTSRKYHESLKNSKYQQRVLQVEQSSFSPLIVGCTGGAATAAIRIMQLIADKISEKKHENYAETKNYKRTKINFALLRSAILRIRGCKSLRKTQFLDNFISAVVEEGPLK